VGAVFLQILPKSRLKVDEFRLYASKRSAGTRLVYAGKSLEVREATPDVFRGVDIVFISATTEVSKTLCPAAAKAGAMSMDDSSASRLEPNVPLVVPEVNAEDLAKHQRIVAPPNCTTVPLVMTLHALRRAAPVTRVTVATYQAVSGAGAAAVRELT